MHYILSALFYVTFVIVASLTLFLGANDKSHAKPRYFFIAALISVAFGFSFKFANDTIENSVKTKLEQAQVFEKEATILVSKRNFLEAQTKSKEAGQLKKEAQFMSGANAPFKHLVDLILLVSGAFAGALASAAITNRAKFMHDARTLNFLESLYSQRKMQAHGLRVSIESMTSSRCSDPNILKEVEEKKSQLASIVKEMELLSSHLTQKEIDSVEFTQHSGKNKIVKE